MKHTLFFTAALTTLLATSAFAHDPSEHMQMKNEKPNCAAVKAMIDHKMHDMQHEHKDMKTANKTPHQNMEMDDPVMQAMMKKCNIDIKAK